MGGNILFLGMLIISNDYHGESMKSYIIYNFIYILILVSSLLFGSMYNQESLKNVAIIYSFFYFIGKYNEIYSKITQKYFVFLFTIFIFIYFAALNLN